MNVERLFRAHYAELFRYSNFMSGDPDVAHDIVQDAFMRLQERPPKHQENVRSWLFTVATNLVRDRTKLESRRRALLEERRGLDASGTDSDPLASLERAEIRDLVRKALGSLRPKERTALLMRSHGFAHREIADALGTTTASVGTLIARSLDKLSLAMPSLREHRE